MTINTISDFEKFLSDHRGESFEDADGIPLQFLAEIALKYSIEPGTRHYFPRGHQSGLGATYVYFSIRLEKFLSASVHSKEQNIKQAQVLQSHQTGRCRLLSYFESGYRRFAQKLSQWLQYVKKLFHQS